MCFIRSSMGNYIKIPILCSIVAHLRIVRKEIYTPLQSPRSRLRGREPQAGVGDYSRRFA